MGATSGPEDGLRRAGCLLQYSGLDSAMERRAWQASPQGHSELTRLTGLSRHEAAPEHRRNAVVACGMNG